MAYPILRKQQLYIHVRHTIQEELADLFVYGCVNLRYIPKYQTIHGLVVVCNVMGYQVTPEAIDIVFSSLLLLYFSSSVHLTLSICTFILPSAKIPNFTYVLFALLCFQDCYIADALWCCCFFLAYFVAESNHHHHHFMSISAQLLQHKDDFLLCTHNSLKSTWSSDPGSNFFPHSLYYCKVYLYFIVYF